MMVMHFLSALLLLRPARCGNNIFEEKICDVGETVTLQCPRDRSEGNSILHWIRILPGNLPEFLGGTAAYDDKTPYDNPHSYIKAKQQPGSYVLSINGAQLNDTGYYHCVKSQSLKKTLIFVTTTFLQIRGPDSALSVESPELSETVHSRDSVDLQCWVQTENVQCSKEQMVLWFRSGLNQSSPGLVFTQRNSSGQCNRSTEDHGPHKCLYSFSKTMSRSDAGTYHCAVAACGQIHFGNKVEVNVIENIWDLRMANTALILLSSVFGLIFLTFPLCWTMKKFIKPNQARSKGKLQVITTKADCEAALHRTIEAAETDSVYTYVTFVYVK